MNIPTSVEAVAVIAILFIPGYIFLQFTKNAVAFIPQGVDARYFFALVTWGGLIHLLFFGWTQRLLDWYEGRNLGQHEWEVALWAFSVLVIAPLLAGLVGSWLLQLPWIDRQLGRIGMDYVSRTPSAWNYATKLGPRWVRVHLKDGTKIGALYQAGSFADDSNEQDIFLERVYNLTDDGDLGEEVTDTAGVWIAHDQISHVLFYSMKGQEAANGNQDLQHTQANSTAEA